MTAALVDRLLTWMPAPLAVGVVAVALLAPLALPAGLFWTLALWSVLLWAYCGASERVVLGIVWLVVAVAPSLTDELRQQAGTRLSPMLRGIEEARAGRLYGELFDDLARLEAVLPGSAAVSQALADQHRRLGQCDIARGLYEGVLQRESENAAAHADLGVCAFLRGDLDDAMQHFRTAVDLDPTLVEGYYNLSLALSELYRFDQARSALERAQGVDPLKVGGWLRRGASGGVASVDGGLRRTREIREQMLRSWVLEDDAVRWASPWKDLTSVWLAIGIALVALLFAAVAPQPRKHVPPRILKTGWSEVVRRAFLPGVVEVAEGRPFRAFAGVWCLVALLELPAVAAFGFRLPWAFEPTRSLPMWIALAGLTVYFGLRLRRAWRVA